MSITVAMYSHDSVGLGHTRRNRAIAFALAEALPAPTRGILIAGHRHATSFDLPPGWDWLVLPGFSRTATGYDARHLGVTSDELAEFRARTIEATLAAIAPDIFIADRHPFGVHGELAPALRMLRDTACHTVLGLREVLDSPEVIAAEWHAVGGSRQVAEHYDTTWIYGDRAVHDPITSGEIPAVLAGSAVFTGYLAPERVDNPLEVPEALPSKPCFLTTVGGGSDGGHLASCAAQAAVPAGHQHLIVTGPQMPEADFQRVNADADPATTRVVRFLPALPELISHAVGMICMGGYNSVTEAMATDTPVLVVPRDSRRAEQRIRAYAIEAAGGVDTQDLAELSPPGVSAWMHEARHRRVSRSHIDLTGLRRVGQLAADLLGVSQHV